MSTVIIDFSQELLDVKIRLRRTMDKVDVMLRSFACSHAFIKGYVFVKDPMPGQAIHMLIPPPTRGTVTLMGLHLWTTYTIKAITSCKLREKHNFIRQDFFTGGASEFPSRIKLIPVNL